ncbi:tyrosine-type recombinase/integrase [Leifsonia aquatica]|uniref:tyrosine-type recombinase/integrase n=1 Tax=Leifsonia aquatica TaxID=144185 RepID=UPI00381A4AD0
MHTQQLVPSQAWTISIGFYVAWLRSANRSTGTMKLRDYHLRRFAVTTRLEPFAPTLDDLVNYLGSHDWSQNMRRSARTTLHSFYTWAASTGRMETNPALLLPPVSSPIGKPRPAPESAVEQGELPNVDRRVPVMVALGARLGLRCCEVARVHSDDLRRDMLGWSLLVHGKGNKQRIVPCTDELAVIIRDARGFLFPGQIDGHLSASYVSKLISRALPSGVTGHMLRHRFASKAYNQGGKDIRAVQELLGHSSVATTQIYTAVEGDDLRRAALAAA